MSTLPWLAETPWPTKQLPRDELTERIEHFLATHWMGVLCTFGTNGPLGSPVEFHADGTIIYILAQPGSPKIKAMQSEPRICFAAYGENSGWASVRGAQLFGRAAFINPGTPEHNNAMTIYRWQASSVQIGRPLDQPPQIPLLMLEPDRIVYTEQWLRKNGFSARQIWHKDSEMQSGTIKYSY